MKVLEFLKRIFGKRGKAIDHNLCRVVYGSPYLYDTRDFTLFYLDKYFEEVRKIDVYSLEDEDFVEDFMLNPTPEKLEEVELRVGTLKRLKVKEVEKKVIEDLKKELKEYVARYA